MSEGRFEAQSEIEEPKFLCLCCLRTPVYEEGELCIACEHNFVDPDEM